ncbi:hypothetical protein Dimus_037468, partial [Dionaea muscipula]
NLKLSQGETMKEKESEVEDSGFGEKFYNAVDDDNERTVDEHVPDPAVPVATAVQTSVQAKGKTMTTGVTPLGSLHDSVLLHSQAEMDRALKTRDGNLD